MKRGSWCSQLRNSNYYLHSDADKNLVAFRALFAALKKFHPGVRERGREKYKAVNLFALLNREEILVDLHFYGRKSAATLESREKETKREIDCEKAFSSIHKMPESYVKRLSKQLIARNC